MSRPDDLAAVDLNSATGFVVSGWNRFLDTGFLLVIYGIGLLLSVLIFLQLWLLPDWSPPNRFAIAALVAVVAAPVLVWQRLRSRPDRVFVGPRGLSLCYGKRRRDVPAEGVRAVIAAPGISLDGGELIACKKVVVLDDDSAHVIELDHESHLQLYRQIKAACRRAWGLPFKGPPQPPSALERDGRAVEAAATAIRRIRGFVRRKMIVGLALGLILIAVLPVALWGLSQEPGGFADSDALQGVVWLIVLAVAGVFLLVHSLGRVTTLVRLRRTERERHEAAFWD